MSEKKDEGKKLTRSDEYYKSQIMLLDYLLSEGFEVTWREGSAFYSAGFCWLLPTGELAGCSDTLGELPPLVVEYLVGE